MDRNREARRAATAASSMVATSNGLSRRRHRSSSNLRDSPDEDGAVELQESIRLRDRVKKERDFRDRERDRDRDRDRERAAISNSSSRNKRRRAAERLMMHHNNIRGGEDGGGIDDSSEESVNDEEDEDEDNHNHHTTHNSTNAGLSSGGGGGVRLLPPAGSIANHFQNNHNHLQHRKSFPPTCTTAATSNTNTKPFRSTPVWKAGDEMIGVSVPRKARSAATKRSHDWISSTNGGAGANSGGEQIHRQASTSPVRQSLVPSSTPSPAPPLSPSSSNVSVRKKIKPNMNGLKPRPPKSMSKSTSNPEELEFEIAEVLYGLKTQSQGPSKKEIAPNDTKEANHGSNSDARSPISSSNILHQSPVLAQNSASSAGPLSAVAPKRKRPRQVSDNLGNSSVRSSSISSTRAEIDQSLKKEALVAASTSSPSLTPGSVPASVGNSAVSYDLGSLVNLQAPPEPMKVDSDAKLVANELAENKDLMAARGEVCGSVKKDSPVARPEESNLDEQVLVAVTTAGMVTSSVMNTSLDVADVECHTGEKFQIDLMAPPPQLRSSPEREGGIDLGSSVEDQKPSVSRVDPMIRSEEEVVKTGKDGVVDRVEEKPAKVLQEEVESNKTVENMGRNVDLQLELEKPERDTMMVGNKQQAAGGQKPQQQQQPPPVKAIKEEPHAEKTVQSSSFHLPMSMASWHGGLPPMGYMAPVQGVVSMDGSPVPSAPIQMPFSSQPRPKRCATHCYIARNIHYMQQFMKINPFWPAAAGSASLFGSKACNLNVVPSADLHTSITGRTVNNVQDKGHGLSIFPGHSGKDNTSQPANTADTGQRKQQILLQQPLPPVPPNNNILGPDFIFPVNQQQAAMAAVAARPGSAKFPAMTAAVASSNASVSSAVSSSGTVGGPPAMSFNYPTMPANETQYLAILQNNAYPFPIPAVGTTSNYRGPHPQPLPIFNGSFYSSQMIHPSQLQQQLPSASQSQQTQQSHQNTSMPSSSSSSQKHLQSPQQRPQSGAVNDGSGSGNSQNFDSKNRTSQQPQRLTNQQHHPKPQANHLENEVGGEDIRSNLDSRGTRAPLNIYGQNFAMPMHTTNFALITPPTTFPGVSAVSGSGHQSDKKQHQLQRSGLKMATESLPPQTFAMTFGPINGATTPGFDLSSMSQNHSVFQNLTEATRSNVQMIAAAAAVQAAQSKKNFRVSEDVKTGGGDSSNSADDERKCLAGRTPATASQSIAFSRSDIADATVSVMPANSVSESSGRSLSLTSGSGRSSRSPMPSNMGAVNVQSAHLQVQLQQQHQQYVQLHRQQQQQQLAARSKTPATSNGSIYSEHLASSSSVAAKFPNASPVFPQNLVQSSNSTAQSPQWKNSARTGTSQNPSSSLGPSTSSSLKNVSQQPMRTSQTHTQISFVSTQKPSAGPQGQPPPASNQSPSPPMIVASPTTSSISKGASGSPRTTTSTSTNNKTGQASSLSTHQGRASPSGPSQKSSPVGVRNIPSILGNPHISSSSSGGTKSQVQQHLHQQQQLPKNMQHAQLFFSNPYVQAQSPHSTSSGASGNSGYYLQRRRPDQQQPPQQPPGSSHSSSSGMLSLCPVTLAGGSTNDPAKAIAAAAAAASNMKGGGLTSHDVVHTSQFASQSSGNHHPLMSAGFSYVHPVPAAVQVKPAEQKQPAGNDNLHTCWQSEKK